MSTGSTVKPGSPLSMTSCLAGSTASRWLGLATSEVRSLLPSEATKSPSAPRWYLTSPDPCAVRGSRLPSNSWKICAYDLPTMLASTLSLPRWAMPTTASSRPPREASVSTASSSGISDSAPSSENLRCPTNLVCRNISNASATLRRLRMRNCSLWPGLPCGRSIRACSQARSSGFWMCMYSTPTVRQYESRSTPKISRSLINGLPPNPPVANSRSRSHRVRMLALAVLERVGVGHQVAAHPVGVDQLLNPGGLGDIVLVTGLDVAHPAHRLIGNPQRLEDLVVAAVLAEQQLMDSAQELA